VQVLKGAASRAHWKLAPASEPKLKLALAEFVVPLGPAVIDAVGAVVSIVQVRLAVVLVLPAASVALTWKVCEPSARPLCALGLVQAEKVPLSSAHWKVEPVSLLVKLKLAFAEFVVPLGPAVIVAMGGVVSGAVFWTVTATALAVVVFVAASRATAVRLWLPLAAVVVSQETL
jgi:hypothetical protein